MAAVSHSRLAGWTGSERFRSVRACVCCSGRRRGPGSSSSDWLLGGLISRIITGFSSGGGAPFSVAHEAKKKATSAVRKWPGWMRILSMLRDPEVSPAASSAVAHGNGDEMIWSDMWRRVFVQSDLTARRHPHWRLSLIGPLIHTENFL